MRWTVRVKFRVSYSTTTAHPCGRLSHSMPMFHFYTLWKRQKTLWKRAMAWNGLTGIKYIKLSSFKGNSKDICLWLMQTSSLDLLTHTINCTRGVNLVFQWRLPVKSQMTCYILQLKSHEMNYILISISYYNYMRESGVDSFVLWKLWVYFQSLNGMTYALFELCHTIKYILYLKDRYFKQPILQILHQNFKQAHAKKC